MKTNIVLNFYSNKAVIFDLINISDDFLINILKDWKCHIYLICKRKKIYLENISTNDLGVQVINLYTLNDEHEKQRYSKEIFFDINVKGFENGFFIVDFEAEKDCKIRDFVFYNQLYTIPNDPVGSSIKENIITDLEVAYIGQAYGRNADRTIDYRLIKHEKVQKIAIDILNKGSNEEILIIGINVDTNDMTTLRSDLNSREKIRKNKLIEIATAAQERISEGQTITIFEASVIKLFKPILNKEYKETFPSQDFTSYGEIYKTKFNHISLIIDTLPVHARVFSPNMLERKYLFHTVHSLATNEEKKSLFDFLMDG